MRSNQELLQSRMASIYASPTLTTSLLGKQGPFLPRSYLVKTDMSTLRRNRSALVPTSSKPAFPSDGLIVAPRDHALPADQTPPKVSTHVRENLPADFNTCRIHNSCVNPRRPSEHRELSYGACYTFRTSSKTATTARSVNI